jgi:hypothetical protein
MLRIVARLDRAVRHMHLLPVMQRTEHAMLETLGEVTAARDELLAAAVGDVAVRAGDATHTGGSDAMNDMPTDAPLALDALQPEAPPDPSAMLAELNNGLRRDNKRLRKQLLAANRVIEIAATLQPHLPAGPATKLRDEIEGYECVRLAERSEAR